MTPSIVVEHTSRPVRDIAYETLKHAIITGDIPAGRRIIETDYAEKLHISRTPLREALRRLERDGLVECEQRHGVIVRAFSVEDVEQIYTIRNALEMLTLPAIVKNATPEDIRTLREKLKQMDEVLAQDDIEKLSPLARSFHSGFTAISGQYRIIRAIEGQDEFINRFSAMSIKQEHRRNDAHREHHEMVDLLESKSLVTLTELVARHIECSKQNCLTALLAAKE